MACNQTLCLPLKKKSLWPAPAKEDDQQGESTDECFQNNQGDCIIPQEAWDNTGGGAGRDREVPVQMPPDEGVGACGNIELRNQIQLM